MRRVGRNRREETIISRLRFGHTALNSTLFIIGKHNTGNCVYCGQRETIEHVLLHCRKYEIERRNLIINLRNNKIPFNIIDIVQQNSGSECYKCVFQFLRITKLVGRL